MKTHDPTPPPQHAAAPRPDLDADAVHDDGSMSDLDVVVVGGGISGRPWPMGSPVPA